jgi:16S rRNA C967 or C1407 C5-methylase (RsmB/RsmF family)/NOL1/NOP2/fmu family ribosome biogenesis protein
MVLPEKFKEYLQEAIGSERASIVVAAILTGEPQLSVRINPRKWSMDGIVDSHLSESLSGDKVPWCKEGLYLSERPVFTLDPALHAGAYYVQEPSSMILSLLEPFLRELNSFNSVQRLASVNGGISGSVRLLDLCAAPGGKSTHLASMMPEGSELTANEVIRTRVGPLRENIIKWGYPGVDVTSFDAAEFHRRGYVFNFILVDAPCSGEGMFRKDPSAIKEWSEEAVKLSASRQRRILSDIWSALSPGGLIAYSTCTMNRYENEDNIKWLMDSFDAIPVDLFGGNSVISADRSSLFLKEEAIKSGIIFSENHSIRLLPGYVKGEGLFFALLRKPDIGETILSRVSFKEGKIAEKYSSNSKQKSREKGVPNVITKKNSIAEAPEHNDALSLYYSGEWPSVELSKEDALTYLSRGTIKFTDQPLGYLRVTYGGLGLGFVKNLGTRANNLLPMNQRIRMQF